ncbi:hypothetical protein EDC96DRAFT_482384 [Choanephora cucurbitarum]|nr:hypothetical protein EDC96DRAFT_482384 [Choanephora cucurbitarum]
MKTYPILPTWLPSSEHWLISPKARQVLEISIAKPSRFRRHWQFLSKLLPRRIPLLVPKAARSPSSSWKLFWSLPLPAKAFSPWWQLSYGTIGYASKLHSWNSTSFSTSLCRICGFEAETLYHFVVDCRFKWSFWQQYFAERDLTTTFPSIMSVRLALVDLTDTEGNLLSADLLVAVGMSLTTLWRYHWQTFIDEDLWYPAVAVALCKES